MTMSPVVEVSSTDARGWRWVGRTLRANPAAAVGLVLFLLIVFAAVFGPLIAPTELHERVGDPFGRPSATHWLGLDDGGEDMRTLLLYATRTSLIVGLAATAVAMTLGLTLGVLAGYAGGRTDSVIGRIVDFFLVIPEVPLMMVIAAVWGAGMWKMVIVIGIVLWTWTARVMRAQTKSIRERVYVRRARALGATHWHTVTRHVVPQLAPLIVVNTVLTVAVAIFDETALSFLGLGDPSRVSLGQLIDIAAERNAASVGAWWAIVYPGAVVTLLILSLTLMGTALEDSLNPRLRVSHLSRRHFTLLPNRRTGRSL
jgi:peptide/nickel transport system permease protein